MTGSTGKNLAILLEAGAVGIVLHVNPNYGCNKARRVDLALICSLLFPTARWVDFDTKWPHICGHRKLFFYAKSALTKQ